MPGTGTFAVVAAVVVAFNVPFGFWRAGTRKLSLPWFVAVHGPVPLVVATRMLAGIPWRLATLPLMVGSYALGQYLGGRLRRRADAAPGREPRSPLLTGSARSGDTGRARERVTDDDLPQA